jgi:chromosome segregation ATPase
MTMKNTIKNQLAASIKDEILVIERYLERTRDPQTFETGKIKPNVNSLTILLPGMAAEIAAVSKQLEKNNELNRNLEQDCLSLTGESKTLSKNLREKNQELKKSQEILNMLKGPLSREKLKAFEQLHEEVRKLEESIAAKKNQSAELQEKAEAFEALKEKLARCIDASDEEKGKISQLQQDIRECEHQLEELKAQEPQRLEDIRNQRLLTVLRWALTAKHENLDPPHWEKLLEILEIEDEKQ